MMLDSDSVLNTPAQWRSINGRPTFTMIELLEFINAIPRAGAQPAVQTAAQTATQPANA